MMALPQIKEEMALLRIKEEMMEEAVMERLRLRRTSGLSRAPKSGSPHRECSPSRVI